LSEQVTEGAEDVAAGERGVVEVEDGVLFVGEVFQAVGQQVAFAGAVGGGEDAAGADADGLPEASLGCIEAGPPEWGADGFAEGHGGRPPEEFELSFEIVFSGWIHSCSSFCS